jgi:8-oxo-dGTP pyrophosphatase MutT (NUDIX family)
MVQRCRRKRLGSEIVISHPFMDLVRHRIETEGGAWREVVTLAMPDWVACAAITADGRFVLVRQHRHGVDAATLEPAGGLVDPGESPEVAALRELLEETGFAASGVESLGWVHPNPVLQDNRCHMFLARDARSVSEPQVSEAEETEVVILDAAELRAALQDGTITHALAIVALGRALERWRSDPGDRG